MCYSECFASRACAVVEEALSRKDLDLERSELTCFVLDFEEAWFEFFKLVKVILILKKRELDGKYKRHDFFFLGLIELKIGVGFDKWGLKLKIECFFWEMGWWPNEGVLGRIKTFFKVYLDVGVKPDSERTMDAFGGRKTIFFHKYVV